VTHYVTICLPCPETNPDSSVIQPVSDYRDRTSSGLQPLIQ
jgi:hypothetical protein